VLDYLAITSPIGKDSLHYITIHYRSFL